MIIFYDTFNNFIKISRASNKKEESYYFEKEFDFDLKSLDNKIKATTVFLGLPEAAELKKDKNNQLIMADDVLGIGTFKMPNLKKQRLSDIFTTTFRLAFANDRAFVYEGYEIEKDEKNVTYQYEFARRDSINRLLNVYKNSGVIIDSKNVFASLFAISDKGTAPYPVATLIVGKKNSEFIIVKGEKIVSINIIEYGSEVLLKQEYLQSGFNYGNEQSLKVAGHIMNHISLRQDVNDENINKTDPKDGLSYNEPKELRVLREGPLEQYIIRNNFRKFYTRLLEIVATYSKGPWYFPLKEINVICDTEVLGYLVDISNEDNELRFLSTSDTIDDIFQKGIKNNPMYSKGIKKERRKIDWKAFLNMEIGPKKKKD